MFTVATNIVASRPPERRLTGMPTARANFTHRAKISFIQYWIIFQKLLSYHASLTWISSTSFQCSVNMPRFCKAVGLYSRYYLLLALSDSRWLVIYSLTTLAWTPRLQVWKPAGKHPLPSFNRVKIWNPDSKIIYPSQSLHCSPVMSRPHGIIFRQVTLTILLYQNCENFTHIYLLILFQGESEVYTKLCFSLEGV